jgi:RimJ/RimL family protein N-acetyltransferase
LPLLEGRRVTLRGFLIEDIQSIYGWLRRPEIARYLYSASLPKTLRETETYVEQQIGHVDPLNRAFIIALRAEATSIGVTGCHNIDWPNRSAEIGIYIGEPEQLGKGYGTEAMELLLAYSFNELNLHRVFLRVFDFNSRAIESYRKCGFSEEGRLREVIFREGDYHDVLVMSILEEEFSAFAESD